MNYHANTAVLFLSLNLSSLCVSLPALVRPVEAGPAIVQHDVGVASLLVALNHHHVGHPPAHPSNNNKERRPQHSFCCRWNWLYPCPPFLAKNGKASTFHQREKLLESRDRRKIRLIEGKKFTCKGTLRQVFICLRPRTPYYQPPLHTECVYTVRYTYSHRERGEGGRELVQREGYRGETVHKAGSKIPTWLTLSPVYKLW